MMRKLLSESQNGNLPDSMLVNVNNPDGSKSVAKLNLQAAEDFNRMVSAANQENIDIKLSGPNSGYRKLGSDEGDWRTTCNNQGFTQWCAWKKWKAGVGNLAARPGTSNHGTGSAVDVRGCKSGTKVHKWLVKNAKNYGFYPIPSESWHWEHRASISGLGFGNQNSSSVQDDISTTTPSSSITTNDLSKLTGINFQDKTDSEKKGFLNFLLSALGLEGLTSLTQSLKTKGGDSTEVENAIEKIRSSISNKPSDSKNSKIISASGKWDKIEEGSEVEKALKQVESKTGAVISQNNIDNEFSQEGGIYPDNKKLDSAAVDALKDLLGELYKNFPNAPTPTNSNCGNIKGCISGYRGYQTQVETFSKKVVGGNISERQKVSALPGFSQHHTGKTFDILSLETSWWKDNSNIKRWVENNVEKYGFEISYPNQGPLRMAEPWHIKYTKGGSLNENEYYKVLNIYEEINRIKNLIV